MDDITDNIFLLVGNLVSKRNDLVKSFLIEIKKLNLISFFNDDSMIAKLKDIANIDNELETIKKRYEEIWSFDILKFVENELNDSNDFKAKLEEFRKKVNH